jgi:hypothetical protein
MTTETTAETHTDHEPMPWWRWAYRLGRVAVMLILAYWLSRTGDAFFYQGF